MAELAAWNTHAINLPDHADNLIHTDAGARAAGFERALVAGTTIYAYLTHVPVAANGLAWIERGGCELRLRRPVFDNELVECIPTDRDGSTVVDATVAGDVRASIRLIDDPVPLPDRPGEALTGLDLEILPSHLDYGVRGGDDLTVYLEESVAPPVTWANLANQVFMENLVTGPWIHTRSLITHEGLARLGSNVTAEATLIRRFESRAGERALVDIVFRSDGKRVASVEHEAVIVLP